MIEFFSMRMWGLCLHFLLTTFLIWTRSPCINVSLSSKATNDDFASAEASYLTLISFGLILLTIEFLMLPFNYAKISFRSTIAMGLDFAASFFISWMVLDGLNWTTYIYIFVFCVIVPTVWELLVVLPVAYMRLWAATVVGARRTYFAAAEGVRLLASCGDYFFDDCFNPAPQG